MSKPRLAYLEGSQTNVKLDPFGVASSWPNAEYEVGVLRAFLAFAENDRIKVKRRKLRTLAMPLVGEEIS